MHVVIVACNFHMGFHHFLHMYTSCVPILSVFLFMQSLYFLSNFLNLLFTCNIVQAIIYVQTQKKLHCSCMQYCRFTKICVLMYMRHQYTFVID